MTAHLTAPPARRHASGVLALLVLGAAALAGPAAGQKTSFSPSLSLGAFYSDNPGFIGDRGPSDAGYTAGLTLPVTRETRRATLSLVYQPSLVRFVDLEELDHVSHSLVLDATRRPTPVSAVDLRIGYLRSQQQGDAASSDPADLLLSRRTDRERTLFDLAYSSGLRGRWSWAADAGFSAWSYKDISGTAAAPDGELEDRTEFGGSLAISRAVSSRATVGLSYGVRRFELDLSGEETSHSFSLVVRREVVDRSSLQLSLGGFRSEGTAARGAGGNRTDSRSGVQGLLELTRGFRYSSLSLQAGHSPTAGGAQAGTATDSFLGLSMAGSRSGPWGWGCSLRWARRDPSASDQPALDSVSAGGQLLVRLHRVLGANLGASWVDQTGDPTVEGSFFRADVGLSWHPRGWEVQGGWGQGGGGNPAGR